MPKRYTCLLQCPHSGSNYFDPGQICQGRCSWIPQFARFILFLGRCEAFLCNVTPLGFAPTVSGVWKCIALNVGVFFFFLSLSCLEALFSELLTVGVKAVLGHRRLPALIIWLFKAEAKSLSFITVSSNRYYHLTSPKWPSRERNLSHRLQEQMWVVSKSSQQLKDRGRVSVCKTHRKKLRRPV